ncbi:MAG: hypothetical protein HWN67_00095 [Candidatus Helarchaeota archaeon]|nr:hypothetical protein [Candidatus Helarchaeota archaeon]
MSTTKMRLKDELIRDWVNAIDRQDLINLLKDWDFKIKKESNSKFELFKRTAGNKLTTEQFQKLWLLKEKNCLKNRSWVLYRYDSSKIENIGDLSQLKEKLNQILKKNIKKGFYLILDKFEGLGVYIVFDFEGSPRVIEELGLKFHIHHSIQRIRCLLGNNGYIQISGISKIRINLCLNVLEDLLETKIEEILIYSYVIREFLQHMRPIEKLVVSCPREMSGFSGVERITVEGPNVVEGMEDLRSRQEILFNFEGLSKLGAWSTVKSKNAKIDVQGKIKLGDEDTKRKVLYFLRS